MCGKNMLTKKCQQKMCWRLGGNESSQNYQKVLAFVTTLIDSMLVDTSKLKVKVGMIIFGSNVQTIFSIGDYTNAHEAKKK